MPESTDMFGEPAATEPDVPTAAELEAAGQGGMFGDSDPAPAPAVKPAPAPLSAPQPYRVLARKYRPRTFSELIGQEPMVQTLSNAIKRGRLAHAFLMTGVRGVGKTSTARLIAKALNCIGPDGTGGPTIDPCGVCEPCVAIAEGRHIDVIEMDAASHTGVDDVREIIEAVRYAAVSARYKIYIIDEVHMLSRNAFNALLKTLEEPPAHVKFLFATTEVEKLPVTVLSRCQRFDLRRIPSGLLTEHFARICAQEEVAAEDEALAMVAAAAEGSVRDGLSILDQAIAHADLDGGSQVTAAQVRDMLGLADKGVQRALLDALLAGEGARVLELVEAQFALGVEPLALLRGAMALVSRITVAQVNGQCVDAVSAEERTAIEGWAAVLRPGRLHRLWQLLLKGHEEVRVAPDPLIAAEMALLRVMHAADMPDPGELAKRLEHLALAGPGPDAGAGSAASSGSRAVLSWPQLADRVEATGKVMISQIMRDWIRVESLEAGHLRFVVAPGGPKDPVGDIRSALENATQMSWELERVAEGGQPTLREGRAADALAKVDVIRRDPLVAAALAAFPGAEFVEDEPETRSWRDRA
jgi:DNA polymerase-3 subunit gamma/tau